MKKRRLDDDDLEQVTGGQAEVLPTAGEATGEARIGKLPEEDPEVIQKPDPPEIPHDRLSEV